MILKYFVEKKRYITLTYIGLGTFILGSTSAMFVKPHYSFTNNWLSDLGTGRFGFIFNGTLILTGLLTSSFYPITFYLLRAKGYSKKKSMLGMILGVSSVFFLMAVGIFSLERDIYNFHGISVFAFLISTSIAQLLLLSGFSWYICIYLAAQPTMDHKLSYLSVMISVIFGIMFVGGISFQQYILQKITVYILIITVLYQGLKISQSDELLSSRAY